MPARIPDGQTQRPLSVEKSHSIKKESGKESLNSKAGKTLISPDANKSASKPGIAKNNLFINKQNHSTELKSHLSNIREEHTRLSNTAPPAGEKNILKTGEVLSTPGELFKQIAAALGFPGDTLSVALISFLRFFSLSPDPALLKTLRREFLDSQKSSSPESDGEKADMEAEALALVSAFDKGVKLSRETLERFSEYLAMPVYSDESEKRDNSREQAPDKEELCTIAEKESKRDEFLNILNSIPGKSGYYWKVIPFDVNIRGTVLRVFLRLLIKDQRHAAEPEYFIADIASPKRQWRYLLEKNSGKLRLDIQIYPELSARELKKLEKEAKFFFLNGTEGSEIVDIKIRNGEKIPFLMEQLYNEHLPFIDKEV